MRNEIIYDNKGRPDIVVTYTAAELEELLGKDHPVLTVKGRKISELCIAKYPASMIEGLPYSLPFQAPAKNRTFDEAVRFCEAKGEGWHLMTAAEWGAIALICQKAGIKPHGNTEAGHYHADKNEEGIKDNGGPLTLTGSGPVTWTHTHTAEGIHDLVGNQVEWIGGVRFLDGELQIINENDAAGGADQSADSKAWRPVDGPDGTIKYRVKDGEITVTDEDLGEDDHEWEGVEFSDLKAEIEVPEILKQLALYPSTDEEIGDFFGLDGDGERLVFRGGYWNNTSRAGVFYAYGYNARSHSYEGIGFRPALVRFSDLCGSDPLDEAKTEAAKGCTTEEILSAVDRFTAAVHKFFGEEAPR